VLELCDRREDVVHGSPDGRSGVDALVEDFKVGSDLAERVGDGAQVFHRSGHPVQLRHDEHVAGASGIGGECICLDHHVQTAQQLDSDDLGQVPGAEEYVLTGASMYRRHQSPRSASSSTPSIITGLETTS
jgi:hypothetical protein